VQLLDQRLLHTLRQATPAPSAQRQAMLAIQPMRAFMVDPMTFPPKLLMQLRTAPRTMVVRQFDQSRFDNTIISRTPQGPTLCTTWLCHHTARATLTELLVVHRPCHRFAALHGR
jgi:hypothetical protein